MLTALLACLFLASAVSAPAVAAPTQECTAKTSPPPPVDTSEQPQPGQPSPGPVPVPAEPIGGQRLGGCGVITPAGAGAPDQVTAASWVIADLDSGAILGARDPHARQRPASLIKVLLSLVIMREVDLTKDFVGTPEDAQQDGTLVGMGPGGQYQGGNVFKALLMASGNDAAHALAVRAGGVPITVQKMNEEAKRLGALDTQVATPSGLDGPGMMTSAYDMALFYREAMKHKEFAEAVGTEQIDFPGYAEHPAFKVNNDNRLLYTYDGFLGGKTGFTDDARHTYLGGAARAGHRLVSVLMRGENLPVRMTDQAGHLLDWGFAQYQAKATPESVGTLVSQEAPHNAKLVAGDATATLPAKKESGMLAGIAFVVAGVSFTLLLVWWMRQPRRRR
ncbi:D-alanyl-D-alanine carboxypeptidase [Pseudonocardiaceae bacterium YIM PH 21723]|nr:D-alanyl-D-alanine carboxypeptidase [Pseudonocardiaceae bacterium YIM PH 21723]